MLKIRIFLDFSTGCDYNCVKDQHLVLNKKKRMFFMEEKKSFKDFICSPLGKGAMIVVFYIIIWGLMVMLTSIESASGIPAVIFAICLGYFGWKSLTRIQPNIFLFMPIIGWVIFFVVKGVLSVIIGMFVAPLVIAKKITESVQKNI